MPRWACLSTALFLLHAEAADAADEPRVLAPASPWTLDFAEERCSLIREFADRDDRLRLQIDAFGPQPSYRVTLSGGLVAGSPTAALVEYRVGYSPDAGERDRFTTIAGKLDGANAVAFGRGFLPLGFRGGSTPEADALASEFQRSITHVTVEFRNRRPLRLATGSMAEPFAALRLCVDDLMASWGVDPAAQRALSRYAWRETGASPGERVFVASPGDGGQAPELARRNGEPVASGDWLGPADRRARAVATSAYHSANLTPVRVMIDATGQATACVVQVARPEAVRERICAGLMGTYQPALDAEGRAVVSFLQLEMG